MRVQVQPSCVNLWLSAGDTYSWARRPGHAWPGSQLSGRRVFASFDSNGLVDLSIDGGRGNQDVDANEFNALTSDHLRGKVPEKHPAYAVAVGQFAAER